VDKPILCLDFDGVIHSYTSGWKGPRNIPDPPVPGAIEWIRSLLGCPENEGIGSRYLDFRIAIYYSRSRYWFARVAIKRWLEKHGLTKYEIELIDFPTEKPPAFLTIDDRAVTFTGRFPSAEEMKTFRPWYKREPTPAPASETPATGKTGRVPR
jgi:hypothetical protein